MSCPTDALERKVVSCKCRCGGVDKGMYGMRLNSVHHHLEADALHAIFDGVPRDGQQVLDAEDVDTIDIAMGQLDFISVCQMMYGLGAMNVHALLLFRR